MNIEVVTDEGEVITVTISSFYQGEPKSYSDWLEITESKDAKIRKVSSGALVSMGIKPMTYMRWSASLKAKVLVAAQEAGEEETEQDDTPPPPKKTKKPRKAAAKKKMKEPEPEPESEEGEDETEGLDDLEPVPEPEPPKKAGRKATKKKAPTKPAEADKLTAFLQDLRALIDEHLSGK